MVLSYQRIGQRIHVIRKARKLTQAELAERANLSVPYISHIENGIKQDSLQAVVNIAEVALFLHFSTAFGGYFTTVAYLRIGSKNHSHILRQP